MNVFLVYTPLHSLIVNAIINHEQLKSFHLIYLYDIKTSKSDYYYNNLAKKSSVSYYQKKSVNLSFVFLFFKMLRFRRQECNIYTGNLKTLPSRLIALALNAKIHTFDDGLANIIKAGYLFEKNEHILSKTIFTIFSKKLLYKNVFQNIQKHYSIYKLPNIYPNVVNISIGLSQNRKIIEPKNGAVSLFLSPLFSETSDKIMSFDEEVIFINNVVDKFNIDFVIPHPRNKNEKLSEKNVSKKIIDERIAEEITIGLLEKYKTVNVYASYSAVLFNLTEIEGINLYNVKNSGYENYTQLANTDLNTIMEGLSISQVTVS